LGSEPSNDLVQEAAWVARCVGRADSAPLADSDLDALAMYLSRRELPRGAVLFTAGQACQGVWIVRSGSVELTAGSGRRRVVVAVLRPGDVEGDISLILGRSPPYTGRAIEPTTCLFLDASAFERLLLDHPAVNRRWLSSCTTRLAHSHDRLLRLLGRPLGEQVAGLLLSEATDGNRVSLPQQILAAMLGVHRPSLNKVLKSFERAGLVDVSRMEVRITDRARLEQIATGRTGSGVGLGAASA
jgi:CRP-like cAMP-binding protein